MKKYWLLPVLAMGISLGIYSCNKSDSTSSEPQPRSASANEEAEGNTVSKADLQEMFEHGLKDMEGSGLGLIIRHADNKKYTMQVVKQSPAAAKTMQICKGSTGLSLYLCVQD